MKIEKLNDNQIRCTLNKADLAQRELKISELAYGTEKAKDLFREMMQQASFEFGFEAEDIPLMIEAIPVSAECIVLVITKVADPEELDTRFSRFTPTQDDSDTTSDNDDDDLASFFSKIQELRDSIALDNEVINNVESIEDSTDSFKPMSKALKKDKAIEAPSKKEQHLTRIFEFDSIDSASLACQTLLKGLKGTSMLYKKDETFYLLISATDSDNDSFNKMCSALSEYGVRVKSSGISEYYIKEHFKAIIKSDAINVLANL